MVKLTPTGVKINTNLVWTSHNTGGVEFNTGVFAVYTSTVFQEKQVKKQKTKQNKNKNKRQKTKKKKQLGKKKRTSRQTEREIKSTPK